MPMDHVLFLNYFAVLKILENQNSWDHKLIDDAALGKLSPFSKK